MNEPAKSSRRDLIIGILVGVIAIGFIFYGILSMGFRVSGHTLTGRIVEKQFTPRPEEQVSISIGRKEIRAEKLDGVYLFKVDANGRLYNVEVRKETYDANEVGNSFTFPKPEE